MFVLKIYLYLKYKKEILMKNNTKLIMETWRKFINEISDGMEPQGPYEPPFETEEPVPAEDEDFSKLPDTSSAEETSINLEDQSVEDDLVFADDL